MNKTNTKFQSAPTQPQAEIQDKVQAKALSKEKLAFLPAALEIQAAPPAKWSRGLLWAIMCLLTIVTLWACWAEIDIIATAQGKIVPSGQVKVIQPLETGVVKTIYVEEGQQVKSGDKLIALDSTTSQADVDRIHNELNGFNDDIARTKQFLSKLDNPALDNSTNAENTLTSQQSLLLTSQWQEYQAKLDSYHSDIEKLQAEQKAIEINIKRLSKTLPLVTERVDSLTALLKDSMVAKNQYLELEQERIEQEETLNLERANIEQITATIKAAKQNLIAYKAEIKRNSLQELNQLQRQSDSLSQELTKAKMLTKLRVLIAPVDGIIEELQVTTIGGVVTPAQELLKLVPNGQSLEIDAGLLNKDIGFVHTGQIAEIKVDSFPFTKYGIIDGEVIDISADAIEDEQLGLLFPLKASMQTEQMNIDGKLVQLKSGMSVTVEIKTGTRRLIEFLLAPLMRGVSEGVRER